MKKSNHCSFCGADREDSKCLIIANDTNICICEKCVFLCIYIIIGNIKEMKEPAGNEKAD